MRTVRRTDTVSSVCIQFLYFVRRMHNRYQLFKNACAPYSDRPDDGGSKDLWNVGTTLPDYTVLQPRRQPSSYSPPWEPQILLRVFFFSVTVGSHWFYWDTLFATQRYSGIFLGELCICYVVHWTYNAVSVTAHYCVNVGKVPMLWPHFETGGLSG
jgi:hypothetical protein